MSNYFNAATAKLLAAFGMAGIWFYVRVSHVQGAEDLVEFCKVGLAALSAHYLTYADPAATENGTTITLPKGNSQ